MAVRYVPVVTVIEGGPRVDLIPLEGLATTSHVGAIENDIEALARRVERLERAQERETTEETGEQEFSSGPRGV